MNIVGFVILTCIVLIVFFSNRRIALLGMFAGVLYLTHGQVINFFGINLFAIRILEIVAFLRILVKKEHSNIVITSADKLLIILYIYTTIVFLIRSKVDHANSIGTAIDVLLSYFIFRALIIEPEDLKCFLLAFIYLLIPYVILVTIEMTTKNNPFAIIGGLKFVERGGRLRCMGSFRHPSLLGTLGAAFLPLYIPLILFGENRLKGLLGITLCFSIVILSNSGGPLNATVMAIVGWLLWFIRTNMSLVRKTLSGFIIFLGMIMEAPIWYLPAKLSSITGGDGWHRSYLIDVAFKDIHKWWMFGMGIEETQPWFPYLLEATGGADITNIFISFGLQAGILSMILFILLLIKAYQLVSKGLENIKIYNRAPTFDEYIVWGLGCTVTVHIATWFGITYFDQTYMIWLMQLAAISSFVNLKYGETTSIDQSPPNTKKVIKYHRYKTST